MALSKKTCRSTTLVTTLLLLGALSAFDDEFVTLLEKGQHEQPPMQERESL